MIDNLSKWENDDVTEEYKMECNIFDYDHVHKSDFYGIKKY